MTQNNPAYPGYKGWTNAHDKESRRLGWGIFDCENGANGQFQLCRLDASDVFPTDEAVWLYIDAKARRGDPLAERALAFIEKYNPVEHRGIIEYAQAKAA